VNSGATAWSSAADLADFLDAILTTRNPDAARRGELVNNLLATRGLQTVIQGVAGAPATYPQLRTGGEVTWVYLSSRTTLSLSAYAQQLRQLARSDGLAPASFPATDDSRQYGASLEWNRLLAPQLSLDIGLEWSDVVGLAIREGERTRQGTLRASVIRNLSPKTNLTVGLRARRVSTNAVNVLSFDETAGFVGLGHRF
jgi:uncharacterized protein (PEP-CTERM system associated)